MEHTLRDFCTEAISAGFRVTPVFPGGKTLPYSNEETYPWTEFLNEWSQAIAVGVVLDKHLLLDWDDNKNLNGVPRLTEVSAAIGEPLPPPVQRNAVGTSYHFLYCLPEGVDNSSLRQSVKGEFRVGIDLKTGNQLMHLKRTASDGSSKQQFWPALRSKYTAPQALIDALRQKPAPPIAPPKPFEGIENAEALSAFQKDVAEFSKLGEGEKGGRNNQLNKLTLKWLSISYSGDLNPAEVESELRNAAKLNGCEGVEATIRSAKSKAITQPRKCKPNSHERVPTSSIAVVAPPPLYKVQEARNSLRKVFEPSQPDPNHPLIGEDIPDAINLLNYSFDNELFFYLGNFYWWNNLEWQKIEDGTIKKFIGQNLVLNCDKKATRSRVDNTLDAT